ncbi:MAG: phosphatase PAP2 family protein, partial [Myxococcota bacterium]
IGVFTAGSVLLTTIDVDRSRRWRRELIGWDERLRGRYSREASAKSDTLATLTITGPMFAVVGAGLDESAAHRGIIYLEAVSAGMLLNAAAKYLVQRPRPYAYSLDPDLVEMTRRQTKDSHLSFYSGHATLTFTAAVAGSYLYGAQSDDETSRAALWGIELAMASATAGLRVRAGKHFYSDVVLGALVGAGIGAAIPRLHLDSPSSYSPSAAERIAMGSGLVAGTLFAWFVPLSDEILPGPQVLPIPLTGGAGMMMTGEF